MDCLKKIGSGAGIILISPEEHQFHADLRFGFEASNNEAEYEALLERLMVANELKEKSIQCYSDSQLLINKILGEYQAQGINMATYLAKVKDELSGFEFSSIEQIPREQNSNADPLARLTTTKEVETLNVVLVEFLESPSVMGETVEVEMIVRPT